MWHMAISEATRERVLAALATEGRSQAWMARVVGKSKGWATDFKEGRGTLSRSEMRALSHALGISEDYLWDGVTAADTPPSETPPPEGAVGLSGQEQMIVAIYRQLTPSRQQALMDALTRLLREQVYVPATKGEKK